MLITRSGISLSTCTLQRWIALRRVVSSYIDGLVHDCSISSANALEILQSCTKPSILPWKWLIKLGTIDTHGFPRTKLFVRKYYLRHVNRQWLDIPHSRDVKNFAHIFIISFCRQNDINTISPDLTCFYDSHFGLIHHNYALLGTQHYLILQWRHNECDGVSNRRRLKSPASQLFAQTFVEAQNEENLNAQRHWLLWGEPTGDRWIPLTKGQLRGKCFHLMTSSWDLWQAWHNNYRYIYDVHLLLLRWECMETIYYFKPSIPKVRGGLEGHATRTTTAGHHDFCHIHHWKSPIWSYRPIYFVMKCLCKLYGINTLCGISPGQAFL